MYLSGTWLGVDLQMNAQKPCVQKRWGHVFRIQHNNHSKLHRSDWGWIEQTLNSRQSPPETEVFFSLSL
jgi:hypothetical protein